MRHPGLPIAAVCVVVLQGCGGPAPAVGQVDRAYALLASDRSPEDPPGYLQGTLGVAFERRFLPGGEAVSVSVQETPEARSGRWAEARGLLEQAAEMQSDDPRVEVGLGVLDFYRGSVDVELEPADRDALIASARDRFERARGLDADNRDAWWGLFLHASRRDALRRPRSPDALADFESLADRMLAWSPDDCRVLTHLGIARQSAGEHAGAVAPLQRVVDSPERCAHQLLDAREYLGRALMEQGEYDRAEALLVQNTSAWDAEPEQRIYYRGCPYQALGELYQRTGRKERARDSFLRSAEFDLASQRHALAEAIQALDDGHFAAAEAELRLAGDIVTNAYARPRLGAELEARVLVVQGFAALGSRDYAVAAERYAQALERRPDSWVAWVGQGHITIVERDHEAAEALLHRALEAAREPVEGAPADERAFAAFGQHMALLGLAWTAANRDRPLEALAFYDRILAEQPDALLALMGRGIALVAIGRQDDAQASFERVLELHPEHPHALAELGIVHLNRGEDAAAEDAFQRALAGSPSGYTCPHEGLGLVWLRRGEVERARGAFEQAIALNPDMEYRKYNGLARIALDEGDLDRAEALLRKSISNFPHDPEAPGLLAEIEERGVDVTPSAPTPNDGVNPP